MSVTLHPKSVLEFKRPISTQTRTELIITNDHDEPVTYKIRTTAPATYYVRPNAGCVGPRSKVRIEITMQPHQENPNRQPSNDRFMIQSTIIPKRKRTARNMCNINSGDVIHQQKLSIIYTESSSESAPIIISPGDTVEFPRPDLKEVFQTLIVINPNMTPVAFKVKTNAQQHYCARPNLKRLNSGESAEVQLVAVPSALGRLDAKDRFLIQSVLLTPELDSIPLKEIPWDSKGTPVIHRHRLKVSYQSPTIIPTPPFTKLKMRTSRNELATRKGTLKSYDASKKHRRDARRGCSSGTHSTSTSSSLDHSWSQSRPVPSRQGSRQTLGYENGYENKSEGAKKRAEKPLVRYFGQTCSSIGAAMSVAMGRDNSGIGYAYGAGYGVPEKQRSHSPSPSQILAFGITASANEHELDERSDRERKENLSRFGTTITEDATGRRSSSRMSVFWGGGSDDGGSQGKKGTKSLTKKASGWLARPMSIFFHKRKVT